MATELPAQGGGAPSNDVSDDGLVLAGDADDLDAELGDDVELDDEETSG
jgi:hypothetical protein